MAHNLSMVRFILVEQMYRCAFALVLVYVQLQQLAEENDCGLAFLVLCAVLCNGFIQCHANAECTRVNSTSDQCTCLQGYNGDGILACDGKLSMRFH